MRKFIPLFVLSVSIVVGIIAGNPDIKIASSITFYVVFVIICQLCLELWKQYTSGSKSKEGLALFIFGIIGVAGGGAILWSNTARHILFPFSIITISALIACEGYQAMNGYNLLFRKRK